MPRGYVKPASDPELLPPPFHADEVATELFESRPELGRAPWDDDVEYDREWLAA